MGVTKMKRVMLIALSLSMMAGCAKDTERYDTPVAKQVEIESASPSQTVFDSVTEVVFPIAANVPWTVKSVGGDWLDSYTAEGTGDGNVTVTFPVNDTVEDRTARFVVSSLQDESFSYELNLVQKGYRYLAVSQQKIEVASSRTSAVFVITGNVEYGIEYGEGIEGTVEADSDGDHVNLTFPENRGKEDIVYTVKVSTDNPQVAVREFVIEVVQLALTVEYQPGTMYFSLSGGASRWSPELTTHTSGPGMTGTYTYLSKEYPIELCCPTDEKITSYAYRGFTLSGTSLRFNIGRAVPGWIKLPCPFHQKIASVTIKCTGTNKEFTIYESVNGSGVGQNALAESVTLASGKEHKFVWLDGKAPGLGQSVCIYSKTTNAQISLLTVVYE